MIEARNLHKSFGSITAVNDVNLTVRRGQIFGLLGTNGAGKSTLLRLMAGVLRPDGGSLLADGEPVFEQPPIKSRLFYISDDQYYFPNSTPAEMREYYAGLYAGFDRAGFNSLLNTFDLDQRRKINTFSKGMKKQLSLFLGLAANTPYLLCDETFDGLDPVVRQAVKSLFADRMVERGLTPVVASHSLRELEDVCDSIGLLHKGGLLLSRELVEMKENVHKIQAVFDAPLEAEDLRPSLDLVSCKRSGHLLTLVTRGEAEAVSAAVRAHDPIFMEMLPLTLEEVFISETEVVGYEFHNLTL